MSSGEPRFDVVWPLAPLAAGQHRMGEAVRSLSNVTICELWNSLYRGDEIFGLLEKILGERYPGMRFVPYAAFGSTHGPNDESLLAQLPTRLAELGCDAVISAVGG
jgi:hypothetical protein